jgi:hypothetical protein
METQDAIGKLLDATQARDAIHIAVAPAVAFVKLAPGQHVGLKGGKATPNATNLIGIVDPFLKAAVKEGERFFIFLYPNTITGLRHVWRHPEFDGDRAESEKWLREFAQEYFSGYDERTAEEAYENLIQMAKEGDFCINGQPDWLYVEGAKEKHEMWRHLEAVLGHFSYEHKSGAEYRCSC